MRRLRSGLVVPSEVPGWSSEPAHDWAGNPLLVARPWDGRGKRVVQFGGEKVRVSDYRPIAGASRQYFAELLAPIMTADATAVTGTAEAALWPVSPWTATVANQLQPGQVYRLKAMGVLTSAASTPGTLTLTPRWGTTTGGTSFGASAASATLTTSKTNVPWQLDLMLVCRTVGASGTAVLTAVLECDQVGITALTAGGPSTTIDTTAAQGIFIGVTLGSASDSMTTRLVTLEALN